MSQEPEPQTFTLACTLDDARDVGHYKRLVAAIVDDAQAGLHRCEGIVADLRFSGRDGGEKCRFSGVRESYESDVAQELELEHHGLLDGRLSGLRVAGRAVGRCGEVPVAEAAFAASEELHLLAVFRNLTDEGSSFGVEHGCAHGHLYDTVFTILAERASCAAALAIGGEYVALITQRQESPHMSVSAQDNVSTAPTVTTVGTPFGDVFSSMEMTASRTALSRAAENLYIVYEI